MKAESQQDEIEHDLERIPTKLEEEFFIIKNYNYNISCTYNLSHFQDIKEKQYIEKVIQEINRFSIGKEVALIDIKYISNLVLYILIINETMIIIDKEHIQNIKTLINNISKQTKLYFLTDNSKNEFQSQFPEIKQSYSNQFSMNEIKLFQSNLIFQTTQKNANFLTFIKPTICGYILLQSLNLTRRDRYSNKEDTNYEYKDFILIRNVGETTNLYLNVNDQLLYIVSRLSPALFN